ncbi:TPA: hypothetical protein U0R25_000288 [Klebsiella pneumoniae]|nr:hypothetical protein [Klebsiella pneumoniae]THI83165.1 hypothetical protein E9159_19815 [Klebsiella pneumoniae subsp. pneumoniae]EKX5012892.1 hypothetical protein [Klebsiella pneumoniae]EKX6663845.1 hypothetical protein [Klebsiella pneumoniae]HBY8231905.1 hypothetical protein [Klebsiella pneumoniae]
MINRDKLKHILEYARQQQKFASPSCRIPPGDMVEIMERLLLAESVCTCPSGDGSLRWPCPVHPGNSPAIGIDLASGPDRTVEVHYVAPPGYVMVPKEPTEAMMLHNSGCQHHAWDDPGCAMRQTRRLIWSHMLAAAPQSPGSEPATVPGKWIPVSERMPLPAAPQEVKGE